MCLVQIEEVKKIRKSKLFDKCLCVVDKGAPYTVVNERIKALNGFYNGMGWYVEHHHKNAVDELCQNASLQYLEIPLSDTFENFRRQHKAAYYHEKAFKTRQRIDQLKEFLNIPREQDIDESLDDEQYKWLTSIPEWQELEKLVDEYNILQKRINQAEEEERLSKLSLDTSGNFKYLLDPVTEDQITEEVKNISSGSSVGYKIGEIDLKIPGGAVSIIAGPTSHGKTAMLINFALGALHYPGQEDKNIYFFSYEESRASIISLFLNTYIGETLSRNNRDSIKGFFRDGSMQYMSSEGSPNPRQIFPKRKQEFFGILAKNRLNVFYSEYSALELIAAIRFLKKNTNVGLICIDYMQLINFGTAKFGSRQEELKEVCLLLKNCAVETGLPILLAAQFSRQVTCEADLSPIYISEAGDIERVSNLILGFWNRNFAGFTKDGNINKNGKKIPPEPRIYMEILKGRGIGAGFSEVLDFNGNTGKISNLTHLKSPVSVEY